MKNRTSKLRVIAGVILGALVLSCSDEFIEETPKGAVLEDNYYKNETEAYSGLIAVYDIMKKQAGGFENMITFFNAADDDIFAGGGSATDGAGIQAVDRYTINEGIMPGSYWNDYYQGIFRANVLLQKLPGVPMDESKKLRFEAEAKALRGFYHFQLVTMFGNIPMFTRTLLPSEIYSVTQSTPEEVYAQVELDLIEAIPNLPMTIIDMSTEAGRFTQGSARALLGKVYLYQGKNSLAAEQFAMVNGTPGGVSQYGYSLVPSYASLWVQNNDFNSESILESSYSQLGRSGWGFWGSGADEGNTVNQMVGPRGFGSDDASVPSYIAGWSFNTVSPNLYNAYSANDQRRDVNILNVGALVAANLAHYSPSHQDTGFFLKKFMPTTSDVTTEGGNAELNFRQNTYVIRLADTYLMEAEALGGSGPRAQALLDAVRLRAGLTSVPVSMAAIWNERRLEFAGEGLRFFDLVRSGQAAAVLGPLGYNSFNSVMPIPLNELTNTQLVQNPGYNQ